MKGVLEAIRARIRTKESARQKALKKAEEKALDRAMMPAFFGALVGGSLAMLGTYFADMRKSDHESDRVKIELRHEDQRDAMDLVARLSAAATAPLAIAAHFSHVQASGGPDTALRRLKDEFRDATLDWRKTREASIPLIEMLFSDSLEADLLEIDGLIAGADSMLSDALEFRRRDTRIRSRPPGNDREREILRSYWNTRREQDQILIEYVSAGQAVLRTSMELWTFQVTTRVTGSLDPLAKFDLTPAVEESLTRARARRELTDASTRDSLRKANTPSGGP